MSKSKREENSPKRKKTPFVITALLIIVGVLVVFTAKAYIKNLLTRNLVESIGIELTASSFVVLLTYIFLGENNESADYTALRSKIEDIKNQTDYIQKALTTSDKEDLKYIFLQTQNDCLQKTCTTGYISDYILKSNEVAGGDGLSELHILTNELRQYDFTAVSTLAIASNIAKDVKYIYYLPKESINDFNELTNRVRSYIRRDKGAKLEIAGWIRNRVNAKENIAHNITKLLEGQKINSIVEMFGTLPSDQKNKLNNILNGMTGENNRIMIPTNFVKWLEGESVLDAEYTVIQDFIGKLKLIRECVDRSVGSELQQLIDTIVNIDNMEIVSEYLVNSKEEYKERANNILTDNLIKGIKQIIDWLMDSTRIITAEEELNTKIQNNLIHIDVSKTLVIQPCYSFCLYIKGSDRRDTSIAWYTCHSDSDACERRIDNFITIYAQAHPAKTEKDRFIEMFAKLVEYTPNAREDLNKIKSKLLNLFSNK